MLQFQKFEYYFERNVQINDIQRYLNDDEAIINYSLYENYNYVFYIDKNQTQIIKLDLDNAKLKPSVSDLTGDPNIRTIQDILGINASGEWDQETKFAVRNFLDRNQSLLYHEDYPAEKYAVSIMMYGPMGFRVRNSNQPEITGNSYGDWASLISALDESYRRESSMLEELGSRASMNNLFSGLSSYKGFVRR